MTMRGRIALSLAMLILCGFVCQASAADFTAFLGGVKAGKLTVSNVRTSLDSSLVYGFRLSTNFVPLFGMEHTLAFSGDYLFPRNSATPVQNSRGFVYSSNLIVNIPVKKIAPYVTAGAGLIRQYGSPDLPVGTKLAFNYGGGVKFRKLYGPLGLRFDARGYRATNVFTKSLNLLEVSGGLLISF
jgi:hypothetical protein